MGKMKNEGLEATVISLEASSKKSEEPLQLNENEELGAKIWSVIERLQADLEESNKKNARLEAEIVSLKEDLEASNKKNEELLQTFEEQGNGLKE